MGRGALVLPDEEAAELPDARSDLLVRVGGARIRVAIVSPGELAHPEELLREADRLFYRFPETAAVWSDLGRKAAFAQARQVFVDPTDFFRLFRFDAGTATS